MNPTNRLIPMILFLFLYLPHSQLYTHLFHLPIFSADYNYNMHGDNLQAV